MAVGKPPGLLTQSPPGIDSLEVRVKAWLRRREAATSPRPARADVYLGLPHRLDRPASGALLLGLDRATTRKLSRQFEKRLVEKTYWALVEGAVSPERGTWEDYVRKVPGEPRAEVVEPSHPEGRAAVLHYRVLGVGPWGTWLAVELETGRTHQIRLQAASRGHPVLGDAEYGATASFGPQCDDWRLRAVALHARGIRFRHPRTGESVYVEAPAGEVWSLFVGADVVVAKPQAASVEPLEASQRNNGEPPTNTKTQHHARST
jgi:23S rRNA pseudouridine1911/1915/1917 synthase